MQKVRLIADVGSQRSMNAGMITHTMTRMHGKNNLKRALREIVFTRFRAFFAQNISVSFLFEVGQKLGSFSINLREDIEYGSVRGLFGVADCKVEITSAELGSF